MLVLPHTFRLQVCEGDVAQSCDFLVVILQLLINAFDHVLLGGKFVVIDKIRLNVSSIVNAHVVAANLRCV